MVESRVEKKSSASLHEFEYFIKIFNIASDWNVTFLLKWSPLKGYVILQGCEGVINIVASFDWFGRPATVIGGIGHSTRDEIVHRLCQFQGGNNWVVLSD